MKENEMEEDGPRIIHSINSLNQSSFFYHFIHSPIHHAQLKGFSPVSLLWCHSVTQSSTHSFNRSIVYPFIYSFTHFVQPTWKASLPCEFFDAQQDRLFLWRFFRRFHNWKVSPLNGETCVPSNCSWRGNTCRSHWRKRRNRRRRGKGGRGEEMICHDHG